MYLPRKIVDLIEEYQQTVSPDAYERLIECARPLIYYTISHMRRTIAYLRPYKDEELYSVAVIGLHNCAMSWSSKIKTPYYLHMIIRTMTREIIKAFSSTTEEQTVPPDILDQTVVCEKCTAMSQLETRDQFLALIHGGTITLDEFMLLTNYAVHGITPTELGKQTGCARDVVYQKLRRITATVRRAWEERGWEYADFRS